MLHLYLPSVPPSANHLYRRTRGGGRALSEEGRRYRLDTKTYLVRNFPAELKALKKNVPWLLIIHFTFPKDLLLVKDYPNKSANNRYKKFDVTNRVKALEDALTATTNVDDSHNWIVLIRKSVGDTPSTHLWLHNLEDGTNNAIVNYLDTILSLAEDE